MSNASVSIVTGAGSGVGRAVCLRLAEAGHHLTLVGRTETTLRETERSIRDRLGTAVQTQVLAADIADRGQAERVVEKTLERWGRIDALVNSAGAAPLVPIEQTDEELLGRTFAVNVYGPAYLIVRSWPVFKRQGGGCIVNVSSMATLDPFPGFFVYAASKAAVESLARSAKNEGEGFGVRAFAVAPGAIETPMLRRSFSWQQIPPEHTLDPDDVAAVICDCVLGRRDGEAGGTIRVPSP